MPIRKRIDVSPVTVLLSVVVMVGGVVWLAHQEISRIDARITAWTATTNSRLLLLESAIRILAISQPQASTKTLVDETLAMKAAMAIERREVPPPPFQAADSEAMPAKAPTKATISTPPKN